MTRFSNKFSKPPTLADAEGYAVSHLPNYDAFFELI
jgi:hypothetical protein